jgi:hypothetical protein
VSKITPNLSLHKKEFAYYEPAGPFRYLLMNKNNEERLGVYKNKITNKMVLILTCYSNNYSIEPEEEQLEEFMQNKFSIRQLLRLCPPKKISGKQISLMERIRLAFYIAKYLKGNISEQRNLKVYPNFYYVWRQLCWENNKLKR